MINNNTMRAILLLFILLQSVVSALDKPNIVFILADDLGYADLSCYGSTEIRTPHLDKMAREGVKFTEFYAAACVCTPTRAAFLTGYYPKRVGLHNAVLPRNTKSGLNPSEVRHVPSPHLTLPGRRSPC